MMFNPKHRKNVEQMDLRDLQDYTIELQARLLYLLDEPTRKTALQQMNKPQARAYLLRDINPQPEGIFQGKIEILRADVVEDIQHKYSRIVTDEVGLLLMELIDEFIQKCFTSEKLESNGEEIPQTKLKTMGTSSTMLFHAFLGWCAGEVDPPSAGIQDSTFVRTHLTLNQFTRSIVRRKYNKGPGKCFYRWRAAQGSLSQMTNCNVIYNTFLRDEYDVLITKRINVYEA